MNPQKTIRIIYKKLITLYPQNFREQLGESMEQTFNDLCTERRRTKKGLFGFVLWTFIETAMGIFREHLLLISQGDNMQNILKTFGSSTLISLLLTLPFMIMEVVNRRNYNEDFPFTLFFGIWFILFAINLILLPIVQGGWARYRGMGHPVPMQGNTLLTNPKSTAMISGLIVLSVVTISLLDSLGWVSMERLLNNPNSEQLSVFRIPVPSQFIAIVLFSLPIAAGIIAGRPIVNTLQSGGSLIAYPLHLIIVVVISFLFAAGVVSLIVDQWPCFIGVQFCD